MTTCLLSSIVILYDEALAKGVLYDPRSNSVVTVTADNARRLVEMQRDKLAGILPYEKECTLEAKLQSAFCDEQKEFLQATRIFSESGEIHNLEILIQTGCNLHCKYCFADGGTYGQATARLCPEQGRNLIRVLTTQGVHKISGITFFGGEPSVYPDTIQAICEECSYLFAVGALQKTPDFYMVTNAVWISSKCIQLIRQYNIRLTVSLDGPAEINDHLRIFRNGNGSHDFVLDNIQSMRENGIEPALIEATYTSLHEQTGLSREKTIAALKEELGVQNIYLCDCSGSDYEPQPESVTELIDRDNRHLEELFMKRQYAHIPAKLLQFVLETAKLLSTEDFPDFLCDVGLRSITVTPTGDIYPCHFFVGNENFLYGNIFQQSFSLMDMAKAAERMRCFTKLSQKACKACWARNFCFKCVFRLYKAQTDEDLYNDFAEGCEILKNRLKKTILYFSNMSQDERKSLYAMICLSSKVSRQ